MKLYNTILTRFIQNKQTSAPVNIIAGHVSSILVTINAINAVKLPGDLVEGTAFKVEDYSLPAPFMKLIVPLSISFVAGRQYFDFLNHDYHAIEDVPTIGVNHYKISDDKTVEFETRIYTPARMKEAFEYLYNTQKCQIKEDGFQQVKRELDTIKQENFEDYAWVEVVNERKSDAEDSGHQDVVRVYKNGYNVSWPIVLVQNLKNPELVSGVLINTEEYFEELVSQMFVSMRG